MNKHDPLAKIVIVKEELDGSNIDDIENLDDLLKIVFIYKERGNLKVFVDGGERFTSLQMSLCDKCYRREHFYNTNV